MKTSRNTSIVLAMAMICLTAIAGPDGDIVPEKVEKANAAKADEKKSAVDLSQAQFLDGVLAVVNDKLVTVQDVYSESRFLERQSKLGYAPSEWEREEIRDELKKKAHLIRVSIANRLVTELLISAEFIRRGYQLPESIIDQRVHKAAKESAKGDMEVLREKLKDAGLTMEGFRDRIRRRLYNDILLNHEVFDTIKVSPIDIEKYRKVNSNEFAPTRSYKLGMVYYVAKDKKATTIVAKHLRELSAKGEEKTLNDVLAKDDALKALDPDAKVSWKEEDWMTIDQIDKRFRPHIAKLEKGKKSDVVIIDNTVFQFTMLDLREGDPISDEQAYQKIRTKLLFFKRKKAHQAFVQRLYNRSYVRKFYQQ